ncbi:fibronectin type III domain-containing protein, partial [Kineococcus sp. SYSU DK005]|uniref:fibronectin type III domain-containing protein n=1 Tax=Kineococcus sp. SYSU DK005 TaxID=3383126 RepID=UPI003D7EF8CE
MLSNRRSARIAAATAALTAVAVWTPSFAVEAGLSAPNGAVAATLTPKVPAGLLIDRGDGRLFPSWTATGDAAVGYEVQYIPLLLGLGGLYVPTGSPQSVVVPKGVTSTTLTGLNNQQNYRVSVRSLYAGDLVSGYSASQDVAPTSAVPTAPTDLVATGQEGQVTLAWAAGTDTSRKRVDVYRDGVLLASVNTPATTYVDRAVLNGTEYSYHLIAATVAAPATSSAVRSSASTTRNATPRDTTAPAVPRQFSATAGDASATLSWSANTESDLARYELDCGTGVLTVPAERSTWVLTGLSNGTTYSCSLRAVDRAGNTSGAVTLAVRPVDQSPPSAPSALSLTPADRALNASWSASTSPDVAGYRVYLDGVRVVEVPAGTTSAHLPALLNGTKYAVQVSAFDAAGNESAPTLVATATPADTSAPAAPTGVSGTPGEGSATISWAANGEDDLARYDVLDGDGQVVASVRAPGTSATMTNLANGTTTSYRVIALDTAGNASAPSAAISVTPRDGTAPAAPSAAAAVAGDASAVLTWTPSASGDVERYEVLDQTGAVRATAPAGSAGTIVTGLSNGTAYTFTVVAVDAAGNRSAAATTGAVTPRAALTTPPTTPPTELPVGVPAAGAGGRPPPPPPPRLR